MWKKRLNAKTLVTTPNSDVIYAMSYVDLGMYGPLEPFFDQTWRPDDIVKTS